MLHSTTFHSPPLSEMPSGYLPPRNRSRTDRGFDSPEHFTHLVIPHLPRLLRHAREILGGDDLAWDAVQETLHRIWIRGWLPPDPGAALVHLVVRSSLHQARCLRRRRFHESRASALRPVCCPEDPQVALEDDERAEAVREAVKGISEEYRSVLELFEFHGESYESIADQLGLPVGTVRSRLHRARVLLRRGLESRFAVA